MHGQIHATLFKSTVEAINIVWISFLSPLNTYTGHDRNIAHNTTQHRQWWPGIDARQANIESPILGDPFVAHDACLPVSVTDTDDLGLAWTESTIMADIRAALQPLEVVPPVMQPSSSQPETLSFIGIFLSGAPMRD
jgi:hypothetical protein